MFVEGRQILDAFLIANEVVDSMLKRKEGWGAHDHLKLSYLLLVIQRIGFGVKWIGQINWCISTMTFPC